MIWTEPELPSRSRGGGRGVREPESRPKRVSKLSTPPLLGEGHTSCQHSLLGHSRLHTGGRGTRPNLIPTPPRTHRPTTGPQKHIDLYARSQRLETVRGVTWTTRKVGSQIIEVKKRVPKNPSKNPDFLFFVVETTSLGHLLETGDKSYSGYPKGPTL